MGRLGNQMFEYAALRGIAANKGYDWCIPPFHIKGIENYSLDRAFTLQSVQSQNLLVLDNGHAPVVGERYFHFDEDLFNNCEDNTNIDGYLQSEKYFKHIEKEIKEDFEFVDDIREPCLEFTCLHDKLIFLHVRRGDNIGREHLHPVPTFDYYEKALEHFDSDSKVLVVSDDVEWCRKQKFFEDKRFFINEEVEQYDHKCMEGDGVYRKSFIPYVDLCLMSQCNGAIISPSTLSWWGAWLQKDRNNPVIAPDPWFGPQLLKDNDTKDLIPDDWIKLSW